MGQQRKTRIQARNEEAILKSAQAVFAASGLHGATMEKIAERADMSQPNLHRYFATKADLYGAVLERTLDAWFEPLCQIDPDGDPATELRKYVARKLEMARCAPEASRVFAHELLQGAPHLKARLAETIKPKVDAFAHIIDRWATDGRIQQIDPRHFLFMLWGATQHYSDFQPQVLVALNRSRLTKADFKTAEDTICSSLLTGIIRAERDGA